MDSNLKQRIDALQKELHSYYPLPEEIQDKIDKKFRLEFNYNSNHIEGNTLTYGETELFLFFDETKGGHTGREYEEMRASDVALRLIAEQAKNKEQPLTETFVKQLNSTILVRPYWKDAITADGQATQREITVGDYKKFPNSVRLPNGEIFHYSSPFDTPAQMTDLTNWFREEMEKKELHPVELAALLHYRFVRIHPFDDGNGRISRLLMNYVLLYNDFPPVVIKSADKRNYLSALHSADVGDLDAFVNYVGEQLIWSLEISIQAAKGGSIEEVDDVEKEIKLYAKKLQKNPKIKTDLHKEIISLYNNSIALLYTLYKEKFQQNFESLFSHIEFGELINSSGEIDSNYIKRWMSNIQSHSFSHGGQNIGTPFNEIYTLQIEAILEEFIKDKSKEFSVSSTLAIAFEANKYKILIDGSIFKENIYSKEITSSEQQQIISLCLRNAFDKVQQLERQLN